jgi:SAM-dependent methyltransferase
MSFEIHPSNPQFRSENEQFSGGRKRKHKEEITNKIAGQSVQGILPHETSPPMKKLKKATGNRAEDVSQVDDTVMAESTKVLKSLIPYDSVGKMKDKQLSQYPENKVWAQSRGLFHQERSEFSLSYHGGYSYEEALNNAGKLFKETISNLGSDDVYVDIGAGNGNAIMKYRETFPNGATVIGIANTKPHDIEKIKETECKDSKFSFYLSDFHQFPIDAITGKVSVVTDIQGVVRYGRDPAGTIQKIGQLLKEGGLAFIDFGALMAIKLPIEEGLNILCFRGSPCKLLFHVWLHTIKGFDVLQDDAKDDAEMKIFSRKVLQDPTHNVGRHWFGEGVVVMRRNRDPIEIDRLIHEKDYETPEHGIIDCLREFTWKIGESNKNILLGKEIILPY